jgi:hypothetical protein
MDMAETLYREYEQLLSNGDWKYYPFKETLGIDILSDRDSMISFFVSYLGKGEKAVLPIFKFLNTLSEDRLQHTFSCFLLGILIYEKCESLLYRINNILNQIPIQNPEKPCERFKYLWMLISIFHDFGYAIESKDKELRKNEFKELMTRFHSRPKSIPSIYSKKLIRKYNKYRLCRFGVNDHGICGGIKLYSDLYKLRGKKEDQSTTEHYWGADLVPSYALAAWTVACHNIWLVKNDDNNAGSIMCYKCQHIDELIYSKESRIIKESPFLFLLCLADSIEPIKIFKNLDILNHIAFDFSKENCIKILSRDMCIVHNELYLSKIKDLNDWLTDVTINETFQISI